MTVAQSANTRRFRARVRRQARQLVGEMGLRPAARLLGLEPHDLLVVVALRVRSSHVEILRVGGGLLELRAGRRAARERAA
ncbi:MAG: hypothetical protein ACHQWU_12210 [Gemmatimonadales bacterium]